MTMGDVINVDELIGRQRFGRFALRVVVVALLALVVEGYDVLVMSFAAPSLMNTWHLPRGAFGPVLSAALFGIVFGSPLFGWLGDRIGRKKCIVISSAAYGVFSLLCLLAPNLTVLVMLRFLTGLGLGGVLPNSIATAVELSPLKLRPTIASFIGGGISLGGIVPGLIAARLGGPDTWKVLLLVGGVAPFLIAALVAVGLPESVSFLVQRGADRRRIARLVREIDPSAPVTETTRFTVNAAPEDRNAGFKELFAGPLAVATPALWLMYAASLLTLFMLSNWIPLLLGASGFSPAMAANANVLFQVGGLVGLVAAGLLLNRLGVKFVTVMFALTLLAISFTALAPLGRGPLLAAIAGCGFFVIGTQCVLNGTAGVIYPTAIRARGAGMGLGVGRIGSVIGPLVAGAMVAQGITSARALFMLPIAPLALGLLASLLLIGRVSVRDAAGEGAPAPLKP